MPIDLTQPLAWKKADAEELKLLQNLQGNILKGHGRESTANIFFKLPAQQLQSRRMLRDLANFHVTNAHKQLLDAEEFKSTGESGDPFVHVALSFTGYQALGLAAVAPTDPDFRGSMKSPMHIADLHDPVLTEWEIPFRQDIHGMVLAADKSEGETAALTATIKELILDAGGQIVHVQHGRALKNARGDGIENFGYVDGRSLPLLLQEDIDEEIAAAGSARWDPSAPLNLALVPDPGAPAGDTVSFGSLFVFRKLEQHVRGFKSREQVVATALGLHGAARELAGALIVGRFEDGTPVTLSDTARDLDPPNNFNYDADPGARCPFHAHIRKSNPRGSGGAEPPSTERGHLMARRGIPYEDVKRAIHPSELPESNSMAEFNAKVKPLLPTGGVGLLFMAYNSVIGNQFKFTQQLWVNNPNFPVPGTHGIDPVIGQGSPVAGQQKLPKQWDNPAAGVDNSTTFAGFVKMKGGEYFFSPSLTFLKNL